MAFLVPHDALTPRHRLALDVDPAAGVVRASDLAAYRSAEQAVAFAQQQARELLADYPHVSLLDVVADPRLDADGCVHESDIGVLEASTEGELAALEAALRKVRSNPACISNGGHTNE